MISNVLRESKDGNPVSLKTIQVSADTYECMLFMGKHMITRQSLKGKETDIHEAVDNASTFVKKLISIKAFLMSNIGGK